MYSVDGEKALIDAFLNEFKFAVHLMCFNHVRHNIKEELQKQLIPDELKSEILNDIFGRQIGSTMLTGLVDSENEAVFEQKVNLLLHKWKQSKVTDDEGLVEEFCTMSWFRINKEKVIRDTMLRPIREEAGLGSPPEPFYTNSSECINNVLKVKVNYNAVNYHNLLTRFMNLLRNNRR